MARYGRDYGGYDRGFRGGPGPRRGYAGRGPRGYDAGPYPGRFGTDPYANRRSGYATDYDLRSGADVESPFGRGNWGGRSRFGGGYGGAERGERWRGSERGPRGPRRSGYDRGW